MTRTTQAAKNAVPNDTAVVAVESSDRSTPTPAAPPTVRMPGAAASVAPAARYSQASTDAFGDYLRRIGKSTLLNAAEEVDLARRIEKLRLLGRVAGDRVDERLLRRELPI